MKNGNKLASALRQAMGSSKPDPTPQSRGTGQWLYWHAPSGERICIGVTADIDGTTYHQLLDLHDTRDRVVDLWDERTAQILEKLLHALTLAIHNRQPLPAGISSEPIPLMQGHNPRTIIDAAYAATAGRSVLHAKKKPSQPAEPSHLKNNRDTNAPARTRATAKPASPEPATHSPEAGADSATPAAKQPAKP